MLGQSCSVLVPPCPLEEQATSFSGLGLKFPTGKWHEHLGLDTFSGWVTLLLGGTLGTNPVLLLAHRLYSRTVGEPAVLLWHSSVFP